MNDVIETIAARRSVRRYADRPLDRETLQVLIEAGHAAPSGANAQGWRFVVVQDRTIRDQLMALAVPRYKKWMEKAPPALTEMRREIDAVASDPIYYRAPAILFVIGSGMTAALDTPMVCQNVMLAARSLGIGSCWVYFGQLALEDAEARALLELQEGESVYGPILLGYPENGEFPPAPPKKEPVVKWL